MGATSPGVAEAVSGLPLAGCAALGSAWSGLRAETLVYPRATSDCAIAVAGTMKAAAAASAQPISFIFTPNCSLGLEPQTSAANLGASIGAASRSLKRIFKGLSRRVLKGVREPPIAVSQ